MAVNWEKCWVVLRGWKWVDQWAGWSAVWWAWTKAAKMVMSLVVCSVLQWADSLVVQ